MVAAKQKKRGKVNRSRTKLILIGAEGKNKTEKIYFSELFRNNKNYRVRFTTSNETDPVGIVESAVRYVGKEELDFKNGDLAFCLIDTDTNTAKQVQIDKAINLADSNHITLLLSNPCFEIWFLQHFRYSTKSYLTSDEVLRDLESYIPNYKKSLNIYSSIENKQAAAIEHAKKLEKYHTDLGRKKSDMACNPSTEAYKIVEIN